MSTLHVAALPYPSPQGTQAAIRMMLRATREAELGHELLVYGYGVESGDTEGFRVHRAPRIAPSGSLRSGPSWSKVLDDAGLLHATRRLARGRPVIAHHVEAALAAVLAGARPLVFVAHTALGAELPMYLSPGTRSALLESISSSAGERLDVWLARRADAVAAISPLLAERLRRASGREVTYLPIPWPVPPPIDPEERVRARAELGIAPDEDVILYVGNLDAYQGLESLFGAMERLRASRPRARLVAMTASAGALPPGTLRLSPSDERARRRVYAAASVVAVPRRLAAGVPVKLLDALSRGARVVTTSAGLGGLSGVPVAVADDTAAAFAARLAEQLELRDDSAERGRAYVREAHSMARCAELLSVLVAR